MNFLIFLLFIVLPVNSLYEDQIGKFDWRREQIGNLEYATFSSLVGQSVRIVGSTSRNILVSLVVKNGEIAWRQFFETNDAGRINFLHHAEDYIITVSGNCSVIRKWQAISSALVWEHIIEHGSLRCDVQAFDFDKLLLAGDSTVYLIQLGAVEAKAKKVHEFVNQLRVLHGKDEFAIVENNRNFLQLNRFSSSGAKLSDATVKTAATIDFDRCANYETSLWCIDAQTHSVLHLDVGSGTAEWSSALALPMDLSGELTLESLAGDVAVLKQADMVRLLLHRAAASSVISARPVACHCVQRLVVDNQPVLVCATRVSSTRLQIDLLDVATVQRITVTETTLPVTVELDFDLAVPDRMWGVAMMSRSSNAMLLRFLLRFNDQTLLMVQQSGLVAWQREEALAGALAVEMVDLPLSQMQAEIEEEFFTQSQLRSADVVDMFYKRVIAQARQLLTVIDRFHHLFVNAVENYFRFGRFMFNSPDEGARTGDLRRLVRDEFNVNKLIVVATKSGKLFGLSSLSGAVVWSKFLPELSPLLANNQETILLMLQRSTAHFPYDSQICLVAKHKTSGNGFMVLFDPITGNITQQRDVGYAVRQATLLNHVITKDVLKAVLIVDTDQQAHIYPAEAVAALKDCGSTHMFVVRPDAMTVSGYAISVRNEQLVSEPLWNVLLAADSSADVAYQLATVVAKKHNDYVHSPGIVLADRNVFYKYLNPNLIAVIVQATSSSDDSTVRGMSSNLNVYLMDAVSGRLVYHSQHKKASGPVQAVLSEHWLVYCYWNQKQRRPEVAVLELYEGLEQANSTAFSSLDSPHVGQREPQVAAQSYILAQPLTAIGTTVTGKGIAGRSVLVALPNGALAEVPRLFLDAQRPLYPTPEHREEGRIPYFPQIDFTHDRFLNYNLSVYGVVGLHAVPAGLESTSLVLAYGLDLFYCAVAPSRMFDVLKEDFDYFFIALVVLGMIVGCLITRKLAQTKALRTHWK